MKDGSKVSGLNYLVNSSVISGDKTVVEGQFRGMMSFCFRHVEIKFPMIQSD